MRLLLIARTPYDSLGITVLYDKVSASESPTAGLGACQEERFRYWLSWGSIGVILGLFRGIYRDNGKENGSYYSGFRV